LCFVPVRRLPRPTLFPYTTLFRSALSTVLEEKRSTAVAGAVREQFENDLRALTEAEQDSKELKSAKQHLLYDRIVETAWLPFPVDRKSTRLNSSHDQISYAVFCLK